MRFMMLIKADRNSEAGIPPDESLVAAITDYNEEMTQAGVLLAAEGLHASSLGARVRLSHGSVSVIPGPFPEPPHELVAGFWMIDVESREEALDWARRFPGTDGELELRPSHYQVFPARDGDVTRDGADTVRFLSIFTPASSAPPGPQHKAGMEALIAEAMKSGTLLSTGSLQPLAKGARIRPSGRSRTVIDGPFTESKELIAGFALLRSTTMNEAIEVTKRFLKVAGDGMCELRQVLEASDLVSGDAIAHDASVRADLAAS